MDLLTVVIVLVVVGALLYLVGTIPMDPAILVVLRVVVVLALCLWLVRVFNVPTLLRIPDGR